MNYINILETLVGAFFGAFFAFLFGVWLNNFNEQRKQKCELKRYFSLLDKNQASIDEIGRLLTQGITQNSLITQIVTLRNSNDSKHKLLSIKNQGIKLTVEICEQCKGPELQEKIFRQIDFQEKVCKTISGLYELSEEELYKKMESTEKGICLTVAEMTGNGEKWDIIKSELKKLHILP